MPVWYYSISFSIDCDSILKDGCQRNKQDFVLARNERCTIYNASDDRKVN